MIRSASSTQTSSGSSDAIDYETLEPKTMQRDSMSHIVSDTRNKVAAMAKPEQGTAYAPKPEDIPQLIAEADAGNAVF